MQGTSSVSAACKMLCDTANNAGSTRIIKLTPADLERGPDQPEQLAAFFRSLDTGKDVKPCTMGESQRVEMSSETLLRGSSKGD